MSLITINHVGIFVCTDDVPLRVSVNTTSACTTDCRSASTWLSRPTVSRMATY